MLLALLLAAPGTIRVAVEGDAAEVRALRNGRAVAVAPAVDGVALLAGLREESYDLVASGPGGESAIERDVRVVRDGAPGVDARLVVRPVHRVDLRTQEGATAWVAGRAFAPADLRLPAGFHRLVVDHPQRVSSAERLLRVAGPVVVEEPLEPGLVAVGRVVGAEGVPLPGAWVEALADGFATHRRTHADEAGAFGLSGFRGDVVSLQAGAPGYAAMLQRLLYFPGEERTRTEMVLRTGSDVVVRPRDVGGRPVLDAEAVLLPAWYEAALEEPRLRANHAPARRRGGARMRFAGLVPGRAYRILARAPGHAPAATEVFAAPPAGTVRVLPDLVLHPAAAVRGVVRPATGERFGRIVTCDGPEGSAHCRTDRAGRFRFDGLDAGEHLLSVRDAEGTGVVVQLTTGATTAVELSVPAPDPARTLEGVVSDADGAPLAEVAVEAAGLTTETDLDGAFRLAGLPDGGDALTVHFRPLPTCRAFLEDPHLPHAETRVRAGANLRIRLPRAAALRLRIEDDGQPLARVRLFLEGTSGWRMLRRLPRRAGDIDLTELAEGSYDVEIAAPGVLGTGGRVVSARPEASETVTLHVARGRRARGHVVQRRWIRRPSQPPAVVDAPLASAWVLLFDADPRRALACTPVEEDGSFRLDGLPLAPVLLCAAAPGFPPVLARVDLTEADADGVTLAIQQGAEAAVLVRGAEGEPLPDARVRVLHELGVDVRDLVARGRFLGVLADERDIGDVAGAFSLKRTPAGRIAVPSLAPGAYRFVIEADGHEPARAGVVARPAAILEQVRALSDFEADLATPVRLLRAEPEARGAPPAKD